MDIGYEPEIKTSLAVEVPITADTAYIRTCVRRGIVKRATNIFSPEEINELTGKVKLVAEQTNLLFAFFNNY
jgi:uncharacterized protein YecE (DUF72 family)